MGALFIECLNRLMNPDELVSKPSNGAEGSTVARNRSQTGFTGVTLHKRTQRYEAHVWADKKQIYLGSYNNKSQAAVAHDLMALKVGKGPAAAANDDDCAATSNAGRDIINFPLEYYKEIRPLLSSISQNDLVLTVRNYGKALSASGYPVSPMAGRSSFAASSTTNTSRPPRASPPPLPKIPINLPPQRHYQFQSNPISLLTRAASLPDDRLARKRKQERPSSSLDSWHSEKQREEDEDNEESEGALFLDRGRTVSPPFSLPRPNTILSRSGSLPAHLPAPLPLFQTSPRQLKNHLDSNSQQDALPHPPPLQLAPLQVQQAGITQSHPHFLRSFSPRQREFHEA